MNTLSGLHCGDIVMQYPSSSICGKVGGGQRRVRALPDRWWTPGIILSVGIFADTVMRTLCMKRAWAMSFGTERDGRQHGFEELVTRLWSYVIEKGTA